MADTVIFAEQTLTGFAETTSIALYPAPFALTEGKTYRVVWDGAEYECKCTGMDSAEESVKPVWIGNGVDVGAEVTDIPFCFVYEEAGDGLVCIAYTITDGEFTGDDPSDSHTVAVYLVEEVTYAIKGSTLTGIADAIRGKTGGTDPIPVPDMAAQIAGISGGGDSVEVTVELAMADGDQVIEPSEGQVMSKVTVEKPATLIPENIAEGVDIAGVIGSLVAGGGSDKTPVIKANSFVASAKSETVAHALGAVPDVAILLMANTTTSTSIVNGCVGFGEALYNALGGGYINYAYVVTASGAMRIGANSAIEGTSSNAVTYGSFRDVTKSTFTVGGSNYGLVVGATYHYVLIGGLM